MPRSFRLDRIRRQGKVVASGLKPLDQKGSDIHELELNDDFSQVAQLTQRALAVLDELHKELSLLFISPLEVSRRGPDLVSEIIRVQQRGHLPIDIGGRVHSHACQGLQSLIPNPEIFIISKQQQGLNSARLTITELAEDRGDMPAFPRDRVLRQLEQPREAILSETPEYTQADLRAELKIFRAAGEEIAERRPQSFAVALHKNPLGVDPGLAAGEFTAFLNSVEGENHLIRQLIVLPGILLLDKVHALQVIRPPGIDGRALLNPRQLQRLS